MLQLLLCTLTREATVFMQHIKSVFKKMDFNFIDIYELLLPACWKWDVCGHRKQ